MGRHSTTTEERFPLATEPSSTRSGELHHRHSNPFGSIADNSHNHHNPWSCAFFFKLVPFFVQSTQNFGKFGFFVAKLRTFWCTFTVLNNAVVSQKSLSFDSWILIRNVFLVQTIYSSRSWWYPSFIINDYSKCHQWILDRFELFQNHRRDVGQDQLASQHCRSGKQYVQGHRCHHHHHLHHITSYHIITIITIIVIIFVIIRWFMMGKAWRAVPTTP